MVQVVIIIIVAGLDEQLNCVIINPTDKNTFCSKFGNTENYNWKTDRQILIVVVPDLFRHLDKSRMGIAGRAYSV